MDMKSIHSIVRKTMADRKFHGICIVYMGRGGRHRLYIDGRLVGRGK